MTRPNLIVLSGGGSPSAAEEEAPDCWRLTPSLDRSSESRAESKLAGVPYWPAARPWPTCRGCGAPLAFLLQVRTDSAFAFLPGPIRLLTLFTCVGCRPWWDNERRRFFADFVAVAPDVDLLPDKLAPLPSRPFAACALDVVPAPDSPSAFVPGRRLTPEQRVVAYDRERVDTRDKIGGYPAFLGAPDIPSCRLCGEPMGFILQLNGSAPNLFSPDEESESRLFLFACRAHAEWEWALLVQSE